MHFFSRPQANNFYCNRLLRVSYQLCGNIINTDRLSHVEHQYFAILANRSCLDHKLHCLGNSHEVTGHTLMSNRHRATFFNLISEWLQHAAARTEYVAKSDRDVLAICCVSTKICGYSLSNPLGVTQDTDRVGSFVGGNIYKYLDIDHFCSFKQCGSSDNVCLISLWWVSLK